MTTSHIEAIARAMRHAEIPAGVYSASHLKKRVDQTWEVCIPLATLAFNMSAEICAKWHDEKEREAIEDHSAARACGMGFTSTALREAEKHKKYAAAIRALASEEG